MLHDLWTIVTFRAGHTAMLVAWSTTLLGLAAGAVGTFALLRGRALISDTLAHATLPGVAGAFLVMAAAAPAMVEPGSAWRMPLLLTGATISGIIGVLCVQWLTRAARLGEDAAMAVVLSVTFGAGVVLMSVVQRLPTGGQAGISKFIYGQTAAVAPGDLALIAGAGVIVLVVVALLFKELRLVCFDRSFAAAQRGGPRGVALIDLALLALITMVTVVGLQAVGLIMSVALLITPAVAARFWTDRLWLMALVAAVVGGLSGLLGTAASMSAPGVPAGAAIVLAATALFAVSFLLAPRRGVAAALARTISRSSSMHRDHALRAAFEHAESRGADLLAPFPAAALGPSRGASTGVRWLTLARLRGAGLLKPAGRGMVRLTSAGAVAAAEITRRHRLWEHYLISAARHDPGHADHPADLVEHALGPAVVDRLEAELARAGVRLPPTAPAVPPSPHAIGRRGAKP